MIRKVRLGSSQGLGNRFERGRPQRGFRPLQVNDCYTMRFTHFENILFRETPLRTMRERARHFSMHQRRYQPFRYSAPKKTWLRKVAICPAVGWLPGASRPCAKERVWCDYEVKERPQGSSHHLLKRGRRKAGASMYCRFLLSRQLWRFHVWGASKPASPSLAAASASGRLECDL